MTGCEGQGEGTVYPWLKRVNGGQERQEGGRKERGLPLGKTTHQHLLHQEYNKKHTTGSASEMPQKCPWVFQCMTRQNQATHCTRGREAKHLSSAFSIAVLLLS